MSERYTQIIILCEDPQQSVFARTFLVECGILPERIRVVPLPKSGAGESFVKREYPKEVKSYRQRMHKMNLGLVVMIDADNGSVQKHLIELDQALQENNLEHRKANEHIGIFVPKWHIETWIEFLKGREVDEQTQYPHYRDDEAACKPFVREFAQNRHQGLSNNAPESLNLACQELPRIFPQE